jgi:hypothetical protein
MQAIFRAQQNEQISRLYQDLGCQHHLVQDDSSVGPTIPALTAVGFAKWTTIHVLAYPDDEFKRLEKVVVATPIDADGPMIDGKPERLPKQISRYLLPNQEDRNFKSLFDTAMARFWEDLGTTSKRTSSITAPSLSRHSSTSQPQSHPVEIHQAKTSPPPSSKSRPLERERNPYSGAPSAASDTSSVDEPVKIERERQPYTAHPGSGKVYGEGNSFNVANRSARADSTSRSREDPPPNESLHHRTKSTSSQNPVRPSRSGSRRAGSPPLKNYSQSTPVDIETGGPKYVPGFTSASSSFSNPSSATQSFTPASHPINGTNSFPPPAAPPPIDIRDWRDSRPRDDRAYRRTAEEEARLAAEFSSPRDAERWDTLQEIRSRESERPSRAAYDRSFLPLDPRDSSRDSRDAAYEDWMAYKERPRGPEYDNIKRY